MGWSAWEVFRCTTCEQDPENCLSERLIPRHGRDHLVLPSKIRAALKEIVDLEKARGVLFGAWGFDAFLRKRQGTTALFWGPDGTGQLSATTRLAMLCGHGGRRFPARELYQSVLAH